MKIAFFVFHFPVLSETFILNQVTGLKDRGHDIHIFCQTSFTDPIRHSDIEKYELITRTTYYGEEQRRRIPSNKIKRIIDVFLLLYKYRKKYILQLIKSFNSFKYGKKALNFRLFYLLTILIEQQIAEYDIALCHFGPNGDLAALLKDIGLFKGKIVTVFHGEAGYKNEKKIRSEKNYQHNGFHILFKFCDLFLPMTKKEKANLIQLGCNPKNIMVHRMGVDMNKFTAFSSKSGSNNKIRILSVGRLVEKKGMEYGIKAVSRIIQKFPTIEYIIAGDGYLQHDCQQLIYDLNADKNIKLVGAKSQDEVMDLLNSADIFLAPCVDSRDGDREGLPVVLMEAQACGLPVVSTTHSGIPELIEEGVTGFLAPERDVDALTEKLSYLLSDHGLWGKIGKAGKQRIKSQHDINKLNDQLVTIFRQLIN